MKDTGTSSSALIVCVIISMLIVGCTGVQPLKFNSSPPPLVPETEAGSILTITAVPAAGGISCIEGQTVCSGACRNTHADASNCGRCGNACGASQYCSNGACTAGTLAGYSTIVTTRLPSSGISCAEGQTVCSGVCRNTQADTSNCGSCGNACGSGQVCNIGACTSPAAAAAITPAVITTTPTSAAASGTLCGAGQINCGGTCVMADAGLTLCGDRCRNLQADAENCGACGHVCPSWQACTAGTCRGCSPGFTECGPGCSNTSIDPVNCGGCGNTCPSGQSCRGGLCTGGITCGAGFTPCGEGCSNISIDPMNCGACGHSCPTGLRCIGGSCYADVSGITLINTCLVGYADCGSGCMDILTDSANCGACGNTCNAGYACCQGTCTYTADNNNNCGTCGNACPSGQHCEGSVCVEGPTWVVITPETTTATCGKGMTLCTSAKGGSACTDLNTDENNCGICGHICTTGSCISGECTFILG